MVQCENSEIPVFQFPKFRKSKNGKFEKLETSNFAKFSCTFTFRGFENYSLFVSKCSPYISLFPSFFPFKVINRKPISYRKNLDWCVYFRFDEIPQNVPSSSKYRDFQIL